MKFRWQNSITVFAKVDKKLSNVVSQISYIKAYLKSCISNVVSQISRHMSNLISQNVCADLSWKLKDDMSFKFFFMFQ